MLFVMVHKEGTRILIFLVILLQVLLATLYISSKLYKNPLVSKWNYSKWLLRGFILLIVVAGYLSSSILFGYLVYVIILYLLYDLIQWMLKRIVGKRAKKNSESGWKSIVPTLEKYTLHGGIVLVIAAVVTIGGYYQSKNIQITTYDIDIKKELVGRELLQVVLISDTHIGTGVEEAELNQMLSMVNQLEPDVICLVGDIFDESTPENLYQYALSIFSEMRATLGVYYVIGNHEVYAEVGYPSFVQGLQSVGVTTLLDEVTLVDQSFYMVGRLDQSVSRHNIKVQQGEVTSRNSVQELLEEVDNNYPVILLNHQPEDYEAARLAGVDLVLSGHTHNGQIFPGNLLVSLFNELGYGRKDLGNMTAIVSSGMGTWGFPIRVGTNSEIVLLNLY